MPRKLSTRYADDLRLFPDLWHKVGLLFGVIVVIGFPFYVGDYWQFIGCQTLVAIVGSIATLRAAAAVAGSSNREREPSRRLRPSTGTSST